MEDSETVGDEWKVVDEDSVSRKNTKMLHANCRLSYKIDGAVLSKNRELDCKTLLGQSGWQNVFEPSDSNCGLCQSELGPSRSHPGSNGHGILITTLNPFRKIAVKVKMCHQKSCQAMHRVFPTEVGKLVYKHYYVPLLKIYQSWVNCAMIKIF